MLGLYKSTKCSVKYQYKPPQEDSARTQITHHTVPVGTFLYLVPTVELGPKIIKVYNSCNSGCDITIETELRPPHPRLGRVVMQDDFAPSCRILSGNIFSGNAMKLNSL